MRITSLFRYTCVNREWEVSGIYAEDYFFPLNLKTKHEKKLENISFDAKPPPPPPLLPSPFRTFSFILSITV